MLRQYFLLANTFIILVSIDCSLVIIKSCCLKHNLDLNSIVVGILQSIIINKTISSRMYMPCKPSNNSFPYPFCVS